MIFIKNKQRNIFYTFLFFLVSIVVYFNKNIGEKYEKSYDFYYRSEISGRIIYLSAASGAVGFKVDNSDSQFYFIPECIDSGQEDRYFEYTAKTGDSISKHQNSYILTLYKPEKNFTYTQQSRYVKP